MNTANWRQFDILLLLASLALLALGVTLIYSGSLARYGGNEPLLSGPVARQLAYAAIGLTLMMLVARFDYRSLSGMSLALYGLALLLLIVVLLIGDSIFGSRRWINLFGIPFQPSEPAKLITILLLARLFTQDGGRYLSGRTFLASLLVAAAPALLIFLEPDLGTALVFVSIWFGMVFIAGARMRHMVLLICTGLVTLPFMALVALHGYQRERLAVFIDPSRDPLGTGFNINQAAISIGSGGLTGKGLLQGPQTQLDFLRTQTTDYIFSVLGEELGFLGAIVLFSLFVLLLLRGLRAVARSRDAYGRLIASGIVVMILTQVFINVGVNVRLFPVTGIPLPFISQGGSSLITMFISMGLLQSILLRHRPSRFRAAAGDRLALPT
jgi:rod shape determining protein RodA